MADGPEQALGSAGRAGGQERRRDGYGNDRKDIGRHHRSGRAGSGGRVWTDRADRQTGQETQKIEAPKVAAPAAPAVRGPVVREVPQ